MEGMIRKTLRSILSSA